MQQPNGGSKLAAEALDYVVFLVDVDRLYDVALGLYDFDLVLMVAQKSQKDPKEYLPFLTSLQNLEPVEFRKYKIDMHLNRWDKALTNLSMANGDEYFPQCLELIISHNLYDLAVDLYSKNTSNPSFLTTIYAAFGDWLISRGKSEAAGYAYTLGGANNKALSAYKDCHKWRESLDAAAKIGMSPDGLRGLAYELAESLQTLGQHKDASILLSQHAGDHEAAIVALADGGIWDDAIRLCNLHSRLDLIETHVKPSVFSAGNSQLSEIKENLDTWKSSVERLKIVRANKLLLPQYLGNKNDISQNGGDDVSIASGWSAKSGASAMSSSSVASAMSTSSSTSQNSVVTWHSLSSKGLITGGASGKNPKEKKRKQQKKNRVKGKEGSPHEEEYLIDILRGVIPSPSYQHRIGRLVRSLLHFSQVETARALQGVFREFLSTIEATLGSINESVSALNSQEKPNSNVKDNKSKLKPLFLEPIAWSLEFWAHYDPTNK